MSVAAANSATSPTSSQIYKVALASIVGSVIEQYDFLVTGVIAATIWGGIFFKLPGVAAVAAAIGVYGLGIIIRPVGAYIFGNIADRRRAQGRAGLCAGADGRQHAADRAYADLRQHRRRRAGAADRLPADAGDQFRRRVRHRLDLGGRAGGALEVPRLLGRLGRVRHPDRAAARLRLGDLRQVADDAGDNSLPGAGASCSSSASWWRSSASIIRTRTEDSFVFEQHKAQSEILARSREPGLARHAGRPSCAPRW